MVNLNTTTLLILALLIFTATGPAPSPATPAPARGATAPNPARGATAPAPAPATEPTPAPAPATEPTPAPARGATALAPAPATYPDATALQFDMCNTTDYKILCMETLKSARLTNDPRDLQMTAFTAAMDGTQKAIQATSTLYESNATVGYEICKELLDLSMDDIKKATTKLDAIKSSPKNKESHLLSDIRTSLAGSLTFHQTCMDEIENVTSSGDHMQILNLSKELSSNALAMLNFEKTDANKWRLISKEIKSNLIVITPPALPAGTLNNRTVIIVVSKDGLGKFNTINDGLSSIPISIPADQSNNLTERNIVIIVRSGVYEEYVEITKWMKNVFLIGEGPTKTRIIGNRNVKDGFKTYRTPTLVVNGENFFARDIAIENTAGAGKDEAVALRISADKSIICNAYIDGYQNTLYAHAHRQFYRDCTISGTVDFIFGDAAAVFQNCKILLKRPRSDQKSCVISTQSRTDWRSPTGFVFQNCTITADESYSAIKKSLTSFLGRPWKKYSRTIFMESQIDDVIDPTGWMPWNGPLEILWTIWYGEYNNRGPGALLDKRVEWFGFHKNISYVQAGDFVPRQFIDGDNWIQGMRIPYFSNFTFMKTNRECEIPECEIPKIPQF